MPATQSKPHTIVALWSLIMCDQGRTHCPRDSRKMVLLLNCGNVYPFVRFNSIQKKALKRNKVNTPAWLSNQFMHQQLNYAATKIGSGEGGLRN